MAKGEDKYGICNNSGNVSGDFEIGGIAGARDGYTANNITNCSNGGDISGRDKLGGLVGVVSAYYTNISDSYNTGKITGKEPEDGEL